MSGSYPIYCYNRERVAPPANLKPPLRLSSGYPLQGIESVPKISGQKLYCSLKDGTVQAINARTLRQEWTYRVRSCQSAGLFDGEVLLDGDRVITRFGSQLVILEASSGALVSEAEVLPFDLRSAFIRGEMLIGLCFDDDRWGYFGFDLTRLEPGWHYWNDDLLEFNASSGDDLYFGDRSALLHCLELHSGLVRWRIDLTQVLPGKVVDGVHGVPAVSGDLLMLAAGQRWVAAVQRTDGDLVWARQVRCEDSIGMCCDTYGRAHLVDEAYTQLDADSGTIKLEIVVGEQHRRHGVYINTFATPTEGRLYFADVHSGTLVAMNDQSGEIEWRFQCGAGVPLEQAPVVVDGSCYVCDVEGRLYRFESEA